MWIKQRLKIHLLLFVIMLMLVICDIMMSEARRCRKNKDSKGTKQCSRRRNRRGKEKRIKQVAPYWKKGPPSVSKIIGREESDVKLNCLVRGSPKPKISWELNGRPLPKDKSKYKKRKGKLIVQSLTMQDMASYTCIVKNEFGVLNFTFFVSVLENLPPSDIQVAVKPRDQTAHVGDTVVFQCKSVDWPKPSVRWTRIVDGLSIVELLEARGVEGELVIHNVTKKDSGKYTCLIKRDPNHETFEAQLTVIEEGESLPFEPRCSLHVRRQIMEDYVTGCKTAEPVDVHYCMGSCGRSYFVPQLGKINQTCSCCVGVMDKLRLVSLQCPLGNTQRSFYVQLRECKCQSCSMEGTKATSNKYGNNQDLDTEGS